MKRLCKKKIIESYARKKKFCFYLIFTFVFSIIINCSFFSLLRYTSNYLKENAKKMYGEYHFSVSDLSKEVAEQIAQDKRCYRSAIYQITSVDNDIFISTTEEYIELTNTNIIKGEFPQNSEQVLCNKNFLYRLGYSDSEMIGAKVSVGEATYKVTGIIERTVDEIEAGRGIIIYNSKYNDLGLSYSMVLKMNTDAFAIKKNEIIKEYNLDKSKVINNEGYLYYAFRTEKDKPSGALLVGYIIMIFVSISLISISISVIVLSNYQIEKINRIFVKLGINKNWIFETYTTLVIGILLLSFIVGNLITFVIMKLLLNIGIDNYVILNFCYQAMVYVLPVAIISIVMFRQQIVNGFIRNIKVKAKKYNQQNKLIERKNLYLQLAKQNNIYGKLRSFILVLPMILTGVLLVYSLFACDRLKDSSYEKNDFKYSLTYTGEISDSDNIQNFVSKINNIEKELDKKGETSFVPIYMDTEIATINVEDLSQKYLDVISKVEVDIKRQLSNSNVNVIKVPIRLIGIRIEDYKEYGLNKKDVERLDNEHCIVVDSVSVGNGFDISCGLGEGDIVKLINSENGKNQTDNFKVVKNYDKIKINLSDDDNEIKILINYEIMEKYLFEFIPEIIYIDCEEKDENEVIDILKGNSYMYITDIEKLNKEIDMINNLISYITVIVTVLILAFSIINIWLVIKMRSNEIKSQCTILKALGISDKNVMLVFVYDILRIFLFSILFVIIISIVLCYNLMGSMDSIRIYLLYYIPYKCFMVLILFYIICFSGFIIMLRNSLLKFNIIEELKKEK